MGKTDSGPKAGIYYQYFWIKIESKEDVEKRRKDSLKKDEDGVFYPENQGIYPIAKKVLPKIFEREVSVKLGFRFDPKDAEKHGFLFDARGIDPGYSLEAVREWINVPEAKNGGKEWAGNAFCVLCHVSIEPD